MAMLDPPSPLKALVLPKLLSGRCLSKVSSGNNVQCTYLASRLNAAPREAVYRS